MSLLQEMQRYGLADCEFNRRLIGDGRMTREDIICMAREAGLWTAVTDSFPKELQAFANLIVAAERENIEVAIVSAYEGGVTAEREACARLCDKETNLNADKHEPVSQYQSGCYITAEFLAATIRARGQE
jgi:hypothetical protein